jgi:hypothetical protein
MVSLRQELRALGAASVVALALICISAPADALTVSGRSYAIYIDIPSLGIVDQTYVDTGYLPEDGGSETEASSNLFVPALLSTGPATTGSHGDDCDGHSDYEVLNAVILPGHPAEISFSRTHGDDDDECCDGDDHDYHAATIEDLTFGGVPVNVTGEFEQTITVAGVGTLVLNHRHGGGHGGGHGGHGGRDRDHDGEDDDDDDEDDCRDDSHVTVYAMWLSLADGGQVTIGRAFFRSHDNCCPVKTEASTWGKVKSLYR